ncbi:hypothetical protein MTR67_043090 [Solanum verrucosum]|uniref:Uncharacterized protein n=1 Tax=Solanum verrucosum TaxID=315347 RepID=A0AAF0UNG7_SOLVR|nr:hypothetical protein MTR67_043090 [Solanum verrucosum]
MVLILESKDISLLGGIDTGFHVYSSHDLCRLKDMAPLRAYVRRNVNQNVDQEAPQEAPQLPIDPLAEQVTNVEFRVAFKVLAQANREVVVHVNPNVGTMTTRMRDFTRTNPP